MSFELKHAKYLIFYLLFISTELAYAQTNDYKRLINSHQPGYVINRKKIDYSSSYIYLGNIKSTEGNILYYVITSVERIKAAIVYHGRSTLLFFNKNKRLIAIYYEDMPDELPYKLEGNVLYFKSTGSEKKVMTVAIADKLPKFICAFDCAEIEQPQQP